jgi:hypothetical protein
MHLPDDCDSSSASEFFVVFFLCHMDLEKKLGGHQEKTKHEERERKCSTNQHGGTQHRHRDVTVQQRRQVEP